MGSVLLRNVNRFRGGLVFKAHRLVSRLESNKEDEEEGGIQDLKELADALPLFFRSHNYFAEM